MGGTFTIPSTIALFTHNLPAMSNFCQDCTCGRAQAEGLRAQADALPDPDPIAVRPPRQERSFTAPTDWIEPTEGVEPAVPLRSKMWWNNPNDGA
jgi:dihydroxy-acid dehydratase